MNGANKTKLRGIDLDQAVIRLTDTIWRVLAFVCSGAGIIMFAPR